MPRDNSNKYRKSSPKDAPLSLSLFSNCSSETCLSNEQVSVCLSEALASLFIQVWHVWKCLFTGRADFSIWVVITTFIYYGASLIYLGPTSYSAYYNYILTNPQKGIWSFTIADMINPQWGLIQ
jgi:hypothetical protein